MEAWDAVRSRRNVRRYTGQPIERRDLERVLEAGRRAPSAWNWQPWHFVGVTAREQLAELAKVWQGARHVAQSAATIALVAADLEDQQHRDRLQCDFGQATAYMMLTATDLGIGSGHSAVVDQAQAQFVLAFPDGYFCAYLVALGYPADHPLRPLANLDRRPIDEVVHWNHWYPRRGMPRTSLHASASQTAGSPRQDLRRPFLIRAATVSHVEGGQQRQGHDQHPNDDHARSDAVKERGLRSP